MEKRTRIFRSEHPDLSQAIADIFGLGVIIFEESKKKGYNGLVLWQQEDVFSSIPWHTRIIGLSLIEQEKANAPSGLKPLIAKDPTLILTIPPHASHFDINLYPDGEIPITFDSNDLGNEAFMPETGRWITKVIKGRKVVEKKNPPEQDQDASS